MAELTRASPLSSEASQAKQPSQIYRKESRLIVCTLGEFLGLAEQLQQADQVPLAEPCCSRIPQAPTSLGMLDTSVDYQSMSQPCRSTGESPPLLHLAPTTLTASRGPQVVRQWLSNHHQCCPGDQVG